VEGGRRVVVVLAVTCGDRNRQTNRERERSGESGGSFV